MIKETQEISSDYFICAAVKKSSAIQKKLIQPFVDRFFAAHEIDTYEELPIEDCFADIEYKDIPFHHIYSKLLFDIQKDGEKIKVPIRFIITIDKLNCTQRCKKTDSFYDTIDINDKPFLYFLYIDLATIISTLRNNNS